MNKYIHAAIWFGFLAIPFTIIQIGIANICDATEQGRWCYRPLKNYTYVSLYLTLPLPDAYFRAWWNFGRWMIVPIAGVSLYIESLPPSYGFLGNEVLYIFFLAPLYALLTLISLFRIARVWWKRRTVETPTT
jgi:hypothetical protein